jgi:hypothetical protein
MKALFLITELLAITEPRTAPLSSMIELLSTLACSYTLALPLTIEQFVTLALLYTFALSVIWEQSSIVVKSRT